MTTTRKLLRRLGYIAVGISSLVGVAVAVVYAVSEYELGRTYDVPLQPLTVAPEPALVETGAHLVKTRACDGCHGPDLAGRVLFENALVGRFATSNLTRLVPELSDEALERVIRRGVKGDGTSVLVMPSSSYFHLSDSDVAAIIAYLRTLAPVDSTPPPLALGLLGRFELLRGELEPEARRIPAERLPKPASGPGADYGEYLVQTICSSCHALERHGDTPVPELGIAVLAYSEDAFRALMRTGVATGGRELTTMSEIARNHFSHLSDDEISAIYAYLHTLGPAPADPD